jgi:hypothetical protein
LEKKLFYKLPYLHRILEITSENTGSPELLTAFFFRSLSNASSRNPIAGKLKKIFRNKLCKNYEKTILYDLPVHKFPDFRSYVGDALRRI